MFWETHFHRKEATNRLRPKEDRAAAKVLRKEDTFLEDQKVEREDFTNLLNNNPNQRRIQAQPRAWQEVDRWDRCSE